ncbi:helix-turn-helix domain-containing protein [Streptomyces sp. XY533]|uniref:helix-turn-helix domain-containing protein n=1 Tax=Streptomyces sp. XY533 TaxID=1519481 RepID=UPI0006AFBCAB|nr:helix-turn-helix domain-containing protein [Streptomyces sp. XY533]KOU99113.1 hypothetical protein ADK92_12990 [Streptomyces sp. XY533]
MPATLTASEAAELLGVTTRTVRRHASMGRLPAVQDEAGIWWLDPDDVDAAKRGKTVVSNNRPRRTPPATVTVSEVEEVVRAEPAERAEWLTTAEVAEILRLDPTTVRSHAALGTLPGRQIGGVWRIHRSGVEPPAFNPRGSR